MASGRSARLARRKSTRARCSAEHSVLPGATLLGRRDHVKQTGPGRWLARCPAHEDRTPSHSIRELDDQRVLVNRFAGCGAIDVLDALGFQWSRAISKRAGWDARPSYSCIPAHDFLVILDHEITVAVLIRADIVNRRKVSISGGRRPLEVC
jgi:hypothetical protein